jgi:stage II sporulation protein GA (sporulation sigma-E factor processing peptidase)
MALIIATVSFGARSLKIFLKCMGTFLLCSFLFAGAMIAFFTIFTPEGMLINNSVIYFNISAHVLIISAAAVYLIISAIYYITRRANPSAERFSVELGYYGRSVILNGIVDTGCDLTEMFTKAPVCICEYSAVADTLPLLLRETIQSSFSNIEKISRTSYGRDLRLIPYRDVSGSGLMCALKPERLVLTQGKKRIEAGIVYMAFTEKSLGGDYNCLINPTLLEYNPEKKGTDKNDKNKIKLGIQ